MPFGYVDKYLFGLTKPSWSLVELVKVLSLLLDKYVAIHFLFLFPHADTGFIFFFFFCGGGEGGEGWRCTESFVSFCVY